jgi:hypothetical protein
MKTMNGFCSWWLSVMSHTKVKLRVIAADAHIRIAALQP